MDLLQWWGAASSQPRRVGIFRTEKGGVLVYCVRRDGTSKTFFDLHLESPSEKEDVAGWDENQTHIHIHAKDKKGDFLIPTLKRLWLGKFLVELNSWCFMLQSERGLTI